MGNPDFSSSNVPLQFYKSMITNLRSTSRTADGISDTSSSKEKPSLQTEGSKLKDKATENFKKVINSIWQNRYIKLDSLQELREFIENIATQISDGLLQNGQSLFRTWQTKYEHQTSPENIEREFQKFIETLFKNMHQEHPDPIALAAWAEQEIDSHIHPFADGCGRTSKAVSSWILSRYHMPLPNWESRKNYYSHIDFGDNTLSSWTNYYRSRVEYLQEPLFTVYTHKHVDRDALASVWAYKKYALPKDADINLQFIRAADSPEEDKPMQVALDLDCGIKGDQEPGGKVHSCFKKLMEIYAPPEDQEALEKVIKYIDLVDVEGDAWLPKKIAKNHNIKIFRSTDMKAILDSLRISYKKNDAKICETFEDIFDGLLQNNRLKILAKQEANKAEYPYGPDIAIIRDKKSQFTNGEIFDRGARVIIYVDGNSLGVVRKDGEAFHLGKILTGWLDEKESDWFAHPKGFVVARGTFQSPAKTPSHIQPEEIAKFLIEKICN